MRDCFIVGCGPNGKQGYPDIPWDANKILLNASIKQVRIHSWSNFIWMISDNNCIDTDWFSDYYPVYKDRLHGSGQVAERREVASEFQENPWMTLPCYWETGRPDVKPMKGGIFRGGGTVAGCALHRCYWRGERPILCGVDIGGLTNSQEKFVKYEEGYWDHYRTVLNELIRYYLPLTRTITETSLDVNILRQYRRGS